MHPYIARSLAQARISDLHRDAAQRHLAAALGRPGIRPRLGPRLTTLRESTAGWLVSRQQPRVDQTVCCPA